MKRLINSALILMVFIFIATSPALGNHRPVLEPKIHTGIGWDLTPSGMLWVGFDLNHNGRADYYTLRVVINSYFSKESPGVIFSNSPMNRIFFIDYEKDRFLYITDLNPLFYAFDFDEDGRWDIVFKDSLKDGVNGNERFYDNPWKR